jgi:hypothetical protein
VPLQPIVVSNPEASFVARRPAPEPPRPLPATRRGIFFDVENSSRPEHVAAVLAHLKIDRSQQATELFAVGNWRVVSHETARLLASRGGQLVHSAPSVGVRDWTDLRIAVSAGAWLASARPGDSIALITDDQAFDAVGDVAAALGVRYERLSFRALAGLGLLTEPEPGAAADGGRRRRGRRGRRPGPVRSAPAPAPLAPPPAPAPPAPPPVPEGEAHTAPAEEIRAVVEELLATSPGGVTLDALSNALKARGFRRPPGSPRLITRLRNLKSLEVTRSGIVRLVGGRSAHPPAAPAPRPAEVLGHVAQLAGMPAGALPPAEEPVEPGDEDEGQPDVTPTGEPIAAAEPRRRRRRGGRRRRGRRGRPGGGGGAPAEAAPAGEVGG